MVINDNTITTNTFMSHKEKPTMEPTDEVRDALEVRESIKAACKDDPTIVPRLQAALKVRAALKEQARKDIEEYERAFEEAEGGDFPEIIPRCEAIIRLRELLARELIRPAAKGFLFEGFKGVNNMTNKDFSKKVSTDLPTLNCIVWDDGDFQLLFGDIRQANKTVLGKMGLYDWPFFGTDEEEEAE